MGRLICLILLALPLGSPVAAQTRADTLAIFAVAAKTIGFNSVEPAREWRVKAFDPLTLRFAAFRKQPTIPATDAPVYCSSGALQGEISGSNVTVELKFTGVSKATFSYSTGCTIRHQGKTWGFMQGDIVSLELKSGVWVVTDYAQWIT